MAKRSAQALPSLVTRWQGSVSPPRSRANAVGIGRASLRGGHRPLRFEPLEQRALLDGSATFNYVIYHPIHAAGTHITPDSSPFPSTAYVPSQIQTAYGISGLADQGNGQTIAIVDAYDDPSLVSSTSSSFSTSDLHVFDTDVGLPDPPSFLKISQTGSTTNYPTASGSSGWSVEESLDVEWAHAIAPQANIVLVEANSSSTSELDAAVKEAEGYSGVTVVSMSWGGGETAGEMSQDASYFQTPGVTFIASTGDSGTLGDYPADSPDVIAAGGTSLTLNSDSSYNSESAWGGSQGGPSAYENIPAYQSAVQTSSKRETPDIAFDANPYTGVAIYDSYDYPTSPGVQIGGTSVSAPCFSGLIAIANQMRVADGLGTFNPASNPTQALTALYSLDAADFNDVSSGANINYAAGFGYDMATGLGSPIASQLVPDLALYGSGAVVTHPATTVTLAASAASAEYSQAITFSATVGKIDPGVAPPTGTVTFMDGTTAIGGATLSRGTATFTDSALAAGNHTITAVYNRTLPFNVSTSSPLAVSVAPMATSTSLIDSASSISYGNQETLTAVVTVTGNTATPTGGTVTFTDQATSATLGTAPLVAGTAALVNDSLTAGTHGIVATYSGDGLDYLGSNAALAIGQIATYAGNGTAGYAGNNGLATAAKLNNPTAVAADSSGDVFIADATNNVVREVNALTGVITTIAGQDVRGSNGNGGQATSAYLNHPTGLAINGHKLFIADSGNDRIEQVNLATGIITLFAGITALAGYSGDGGLATSAKLRTPIGVAVDSAGDVFIADTGNNRIREVAASTGDIMTIAGNGSAGYDGDNVPATWGGLSSPQGVAVDSAGDVFIADTGNNYVREIKAGTTTIYAVAGNGKGYSGDGGQAALAQLTSPAGVAVDSAGDIFIADTGNNCVREVSAATGVITTVAGNGTKGYSGDGGQAANAELSTPDGVAVDSAGDLFIADTANQRVRQQTAVPLTIAVAPATLIVTANNASKTYGQALTFAGTEFTPSGLMNGDTVTSVTLASAGAAVSAAAGTYSIAASAAVGSGLGNYTIVYVSGMLTVNRAPLTITANNQTNVYGAALPTLTASYGGFVNSDSASNLSTPPTLSTTATSASPVLGSPYTITVGGAADPNYTISYVPGTLTVTPAPLTITADGQTMVYGAALPSLTASYAGLVNGDTPASLNPLPTLSTTATASSHVSGSPYSITASGAADSNYTIGYVPGTLTVTPAPLTITANNQTMTYGGPLPPLTAGYAGFVNGDTAASLGTPPTLFTTATPDSNVSGSPYVIAASGAVDPDYSIGYMPGTMTVTQEILTFTTSQSLPSLQDPSSNVAVVIDSGADLTVASVVTLDPSGSVSVSGALTAPGIASTPGATGVNLTSGTLSASAGFSTTAPIVVGTGGGTISANGYNVVLAGGISGAGALTVDTPGMVVFKAPNTYSGGTSVTSGTLVLANPGTLLAGSSLIVGAGAASIFASSGDSAPSAGPAAAAQAISSSTPAVGSPAPLAATAIAPTALSPGTASQTSTAPIKPIIAAAASTTTVNRAVWRSFAAAAAADRALMGPAAIDSDGSNWHHSHDAAIQALNAVFAQYGR